MKKPRYIELEGYGTFLAPPYMARTDSERLRIHAWQARLPGRPIKWFSDGHPRDPIAAYVACRTYLAEQRAPEVAQHIRTRERRDKRESTGVAGIRIKRLPAKYGRSSLVFLSIHNPSQPKRSKNLYVGTANTWRERYEEKLAEAKCIRAGFVEEWERDARLQLEFGEAPQLHHLNRKDALDAR